MVHHDENEFVSTIIPYRNVCALIGYYLGVFSLIPCIGVLLGLAAVVLGIIGIFVTRSKPGAKGTAHAITAICLGLIGMFVTGPLLLWIAFFSGAFNR